jgi:hypothetical protein
VLVGDANDADKAVQRFLHDKGYDRVEVFCAGEECHNNVGVWRVRKVQGNGRNGDFGSYTTKDRVMAREASVGLVIWDGRSVDTALNVHRLVCQHKKAVVFTVPARATGARGLPRAGASADCSPDPCHEVLPLQLGLQDGAI